MRYRLPLAVAGGLSLWLAFPGTSWWPMAFLGVALQALATCGASGRQGALLGFLGGLATFAPVLHWTGIYVGALPWIVLAITESAYCALMGWALARLQSAPLFGATRPAVRPLAVALVWVGQETLRSNVPFGGFPWARLAWTQAGSPVASLAAVAGAPGLTFAVALIGGLLATAILSVCRQRTAWLRNLLPMAGVLAVVLTAIGWPVPTTGKPFRVMAIQGNVPTSGLEFNAQRRAVLDNHVRATMTAAGQVREGKLPAPQLVVWPENSSDIDPTRQADAATEISRAVADIDAPTIVGAVLQEPAPRVSNASLLYLPGAGLTDRYVKQHPVPFAEYMPYRSFFRHFSDKVDLLTTDFAPGTRTGLFTIPTAGGSVKVGPVICFEVAYDGLTRAPVEKGAQLLIVQTNNATFGRTAESTQQLGISRIRAIEHGRAIVHVSTVGVSGLITPDGVVHQESSLFTTKVLSGELPLRSALTLADRWGYWPEVVADSALLGLIGVAITSSRRSQRQDRSHDPASSAAPSDTRPTESRVHDHA